MSKTKSGMGSGVRYAKAAVAVAAQLALIGAAQAGVGFADSVDPVGNPIVVPTYFSHSPSGLRQAGTMTGGTLDIGTMAGAQVDALFPGYRASPDTGKALRKFVDRLAPLSPFATAANTLSDNTTAAKLIPLARPEKWLSPNGVTTNDDYLELAAIEYREQMHSDLPKVGGGVTGPGTGGSVLRGYVQIVSPAMEAAAGASTLTVGMTEAVRTTALAAAGYKQLFYPDGTPIQIWDTNADGSRNGRKKNAWAVTDPHYLGPAIFAKQGTPTRVKFWNLLPVGRAVIGGTTPAGEAIVSARNGDLFIPVDKSLMGAGYGPDGMTLYSQNRIAIHLHGGDTPWISDGTAHQWFTPIGEEDAGHVTTAGFSGNSLASEIVDPTLLPSFLRGASTVNVPDMYDPGPGAVTLYYVNGQSARLMWYHDHAVGMTRLNAYAGMAAPYWLTDDEELSLMPAQTLPGVLAPTVANPTGTLTTNGSGLIPAVADTIPLVLQDKCFVPKDIALQDARWNTTAWGDYGNLWFPHVYETVQDPGQLQSWNVVGRWHYGPWFWPVFPALYPLPTGAYGDETTTPEAWCDTPVVNGVAYPFVEVEPKAYRLRILNGSNDRMMTFNLFVGDPNGAVIDTAGNVGSPVDATGNRTWVDAATGAPLSGPVGAFWPTEVRMVPAVIPANPCPAGVTRSDQVGGGCTPANWPTDARTGGVPDPATAGPTMYQFGNEGGLLAKLNVIDPLPTNPIYDKGRITVLNVGTTGLFLGNAERADVVVDFSKYAGQTLIAYNDMFAPVPAGDPRNAYFPGVGDQSSAGGAEDTVPGYGPNTSTLMQFRVASTLNGGGSPKAFNVGALAAQLPQSYARTQERPVVAQSAYNAAFNPGCTTPNPKTPTAGCWDDTRAFASINVGTIQSPQFVFSTGDPGAFGQVIVDPANPGSGYVKAPAVTFTGGGATAQATANATMKVDKIAVTNAGSGYVVAPNVRITAASGGGGGRWRVRR